MQQIAVSGHARTHKAELCRAAARVGMDRCGTLDLVAYDSLSRWQLRSRKVYVAPAFTRASSVQAHARLTAGATNTKATSGGSEQRD